MDTFQEVFAQKALEQLFPGDRADAFFEALLGDAEEGAFDIRLTFDRFEVDDDILRFELELHERRGHCLACNLTYGLPQVFSRHPVINIAGLVEEVDQLLGDDFVCEEWKLGATHQKSRQLHVIPLEIVVKKQPVKPIT
ncbi:MAG: pancreas/duodenum homeobox protein 1 [Desulfobulbus propionicus]|nr:MAG: pancreas/duodenum homeobox protein 1 [Desulfobulbus propionicus]